MCRMLAVAALEPFPIARHLWEGGRSLQGLAESGKRCPHQDGAGFVYRDAGGDLERERWGRDRYDAFLAAGEGDLGRIETALLLAHARKASDPTRLGDAYAHPLEADGIFLAHNGTIRDHANLGTPGDIDSQRLLQWLAKEWPARDLPGLRGALEKLLRTVSDFSAIDLLLLAGESLFVFCCYRDSQKAEYYTLRYRSEAGRFLVASEPLDERDDWRAMENGELLCVTPDLRVASERLRVPG